MEATLGPYHLEIAVEFGPRITSLRLDDGPQLLARLGSEAGVRHDGGFYAFRGGHRLWAAPEIPVITYADDDHRCEVLEIDGVVKVTAPTDDAGLVKEIEVTLDGGDLVVDHRLTSPNGASGPTAVWAITQFPLGGTALVPLIGADTTPSANRYLVMWPYTSLEDRRVTLSDDVLELDAGPGPQLKFGFGPSPGRLGYLQDGLLFAKEVESAKGREVPDFGAAGQVYVGQGFCELESVGGLTDLRDGGAASLRERWTVVDCPDIDAAIQLTLGA